MRRFSIHVCESGYSQWPCGPLAFGKGVEYGAWERNGKGIIVKERFVLRAMCAVQLNGGK